MMNYGMKLFNFMDTTFWNFQEKVDMVKLLKHKIKKLTKFMLLNLSKMHFKPKTVQ